MRKGMFGKLAVQNIRNNRSTYVPYMLTCIFCIAMMYMMEFLRDCPTLEKAVPQAAEVRMIVGTGEVVVGIFCVIFLIYSNSFLMKHRQKEIGLYNILGLEKGHIGKVMFLETSMTSLLSLTAGIGIGILGSKLSLLFAFPFSSCSGSAGILCFHYRNPVLHRRIWRDFSCYSGTESYQSKDE